MPATASPEPGFSLVREIDHRCRTLALRFHGSSDPSAREAGVPGGRNPVPSAQPMPVFARRAFAPQSRRLNQMAPMYSRIIDTVCVRPWRSNVSRYSDSVFVGFLRLSRCPRAADNTVPCERPTRCRMNSSGCWATIPKESRTMSGKSLRSGPAFAPVAPG